MGWRFFVVVMLLMTVGVAVSGQEAGQIPPLKPSIQQAKGAQPSANNVPPEVHTPLAPGKVGKEKTSPAARPKGPVSSEDRNGGGSQISDQPAAAGEVGGPGSPPSPQFQSERESAPESSPAGAVPTKFSKDAAGAPTPPSQNGTGQEADNTRGDGQSASEPGAEAGAPTPSLKSEPPPKGADGEKARVAPLDGFTGPNLFPTSPVIETQKAFWIQMFSTVSSEEGVIHDGLFTQPVFENLDMRKMTRPEQRRLVKRRKREIETELRQLANALEAGEQPNEEGRRLLAMFPAGITPQELHERAREVRFQRGLANRFQKGLVTSGALLTRIREILTEHGVPVDLAYLPHVESSFNLKAYSKFGAAGIWQFTRGTGRMFLAVRYEVDERLDPIKATVAAGQLLRKNYNRLGSWPLAITAYNHGPGGMERIVALRGTKDLGDFIKNYDGRLFKFASKNFYAEFLAAREVATHYQKYFGEMEMDPPYRFATVMMPFYLDFSLAADMLKIEESLLANLNPALRVPVLVGSKYIPQGYGLRVPHQVNPEAFLKSVPVAERKTRQKLTEVVVVERGDSLYALGRRYNVPWDVIARANQITAYHRIRPGQRIVIPRREKGGTEWVAKNLPPPKSTKEQPAVEAARAEGETVPVDEKSKALAFQKAEGSIQFQDLGFRHYNKRKQLGIFEAAFGETIGHYATWSAVPARVIREHNQRRYGVLLRPGEEVAVPLTAVSAENFSQARLEYHQSREEDFFSTFAVSEAVKVKVRRGDSVWSMTQSNNIPIWLFYQHNPGLIRKSLRAGMTILLPVIEEVEALEKTTKKTSAPAPPLKGL